MLTAGGWDSRLLETLSFCKSISSPGSAAEQIGALVRRPGSARNAHDDTLDLLIGSVGPGAAGTSMPRVEYWYKLETVFAPQYVPISLLHGTLKIVCFAVQLNLTHRRNIIW
jgi:hypothetical protein